MGNKRRETSLAQGDEEHRLVERLGQEHRIGKGRTKIAREKKNTKDNKRRRKLIK